MSKFKTSAIRFLREYSFDIIIGFLLATCFLFFMSVSARAQNVGINNPLPHVKSLLDLTSTDKGLLAPRMTQAQRLAMFPAADATANGMLVYQTDNTPGFYYYDGAVWMSLANGTSGWGLAGNAGTSPAANFFGTTDNNDVAIRTNNQEWMRFTATKKIGIGSATFANPTARLEIADEDGLNSDVSIRVASTGYPDFTFLKSRGTLAAPATTLAGDVNGAISNWAYDGTKYMLASRITFFLDSNSAVNDVAGSMHFYTSNNNATQAGISINSKSNVGIGNTTPGFPLNFAPTLGDKISLYGNSGAHYGFGIQGSLLQMHTGSSVDDIAFGYGSSAVFSERMRIKGNGKVGIGTSKPGSIMPSAALEIADSTGVNKDVLIRSTNNTNNWQTLAFGRTRGTFSAPTIVQLNDNLGRLTGMGYDGAILHTAAEIQFHTDSVPGTNSMPGNITFHTTPANSSSNCIERMRIDRTGNVGIGTSAPAAKLDVNGSVKITNGTQGAGKVLTSDASGLATWQSLNAAGVSAWSLTGNAGTNAAANYMGTSDNTDVVFKSNNVEAFRIRVNQRVGMGTAFPVQKLDVNGNMNISLDSTYRIGNVPVLSAKGTWNVFVGANAGASNVTGQQNAFTGHSAGYSNTAGSFNTFNGYYSGYSNTSANNNSFFGYRAGKSDTTGSDNTAIGAEAGSMLAYGTSNTYVGRLAGYANTSSPFNVFIGAGAGQFATSGYSTFIGGNAGRNTTTGTNNSFMGLNSGYINTTGSANTFMGFAAGYTNNDSNNVFVGAYAGYLNSSGEGNYFAGSNTGYSNTTGSYNSFAGSWAGSNNSIGGYNSFFGSNAGWANSTGSNNSFFGNYAGNMNTTGSGNSFYGYAADALANNLTNATAIGAYAKVGVNNAITLGAAGAMVGVGYSYPGFPLNFANTLGDKVSLFGNAGAHYGFGIQSALMQIHTATVADDIAFGYGSSSAFTESMRIKGNGNVGIGTASPLTALEVDGALSLTADASITANAASFTITVGNRSYIRISSNAAPASRLVSLSNGLQVGQLLMIECTAAGGVNGIRMSDTPATYNTNLVTFHDMYENDVITLLWNGTDWIETAYANN